MYTLDACAEHCRANCARCNYVSFSQDPPECAWHYVCPRRLWAHVHFMTVQVRPLDDAAKALAVRAAPPALPSTLLPAQARVGYCAVMDGGLGECKADTQGSWVGVTSAAQCMEDRSHGSTCDACDQHFDVRHASWLLRQDDCWRCWQLHLRQKGHDSSSASEGMAALHREQWLTLSCSTCR